MIIWTKVGVYAAAAAAIGYVAFCPWPRHEAPVEPHLPAFHAPAPVEKAPRVEKPSPSPKKAMKTVPAPKKRSVCSRIPKRAYTMPIDEVLKYAADTHQFSPAELAAGRKCLERHVRPLGNG